jgi:hypothetical protein
MRLQVGMSVCTLSGVGRISYISRRSDYLTVKAGMTGRVLGFTVAGDKAAVEFDDEIFTNYLIQRSSLDHGCHGKGKLHHCIYIPTSYLEELFIPDYSEPGYNYPSEPSGIEYHKDRGYYQENDDDLLLD